MGHPIDLNNGELLTFDEFIHIEFMLLLFGCI